jgi:peptidyl-prolyl cis-trans isomerase A (cyclophilin A)
VADSMPTTAVLHTSMGPIRLELFPNHAPKTVRNFVELAEGKRQGATDPRNGQPIAGPYYDGVTFHRVVEGFVIQGGDPTGTGTGGPGYTFADEPHSELTFDRPFLLAMANAGPGTNGSQFFITVVPTPGLNFKHTIFGRAADKESEDVVMAISHVDTVAERPREPVIIQRVEIER